MTPWCQTTHFMARKRHAGSSAPALAVRSTRKKRHGAKRGLARTLLVDTKALTRPRWHAVPRKRHAVARRGRKSWHVYGTRVLKIAKKAYFLGINAKRSIGSNPSTPVFSLLRSTLPRGAKSRPVATLRRLFAVVEGVGPCRTVTGCAPILAR